MLALVVALSRPPPPQPYKQGFFRFVCSLLAQTTLRVVAIASGRSQVSVMLTQVPAVQAKSPENAAKTNVRNGPSSSFRRTFATTMTSAPNSQSSPSRKAPSGNAVDQTDITQPSADGARPKRRLLQEICSPFGRYMALASPKSRSFGFWPTAVLCSSHFVSQIRHGPIFSVNLVS